ncbi:MAG: hypothetical protein FXF47_03270 [Candidatus Mcinerneyibacterium aminivorans]|uniref:PAS domain-containing protein n=1 Tax=Candidatus Mcinerneyibacterium aminivorans TaxID=2703815 RepID=A0A5D0MJD0_9BACT|nr:MAG: hypothetical protein FXF47_03270 [Candidatus Mcinerneyibacterium aminivorans]
MKLIKVIILLVLSSAVIFLVETNIKTEYIQNIKENTKNDAKLQIQNQKENIRNGLKNKQNLLLEITNAIENQDTFDGISGILAGNSNTFKWIEYIDSTGVPKYSTKKGSEESNDITYTISSQLKDDAQLNAGINIKDFISKSLVSNFAITRSPQKILEEYSSKNYVTEQTQINNTDLYLVFYKNIATKINSILFLEIAIALLALISIFLIVFKKRNTEFDTLDTFMEQVRKGNEDLRFEIIEKDPLSNLKENINSILNKVENLRIKNRVYSVAIQIINKLQEETSLSRKINTFIQQLTNSFNISDIHVFIKSEKNKIVYSNKSNQYTINYTKNMEKIINNKQSNILKDFNINSLLDVQLNQNFSPKNYKIFHIGHYGIILFEKKEFEKLNTSVSNMLVNLIINTVKLHKDKFYNLQEKIHFNKMFKKLNTGLIWVDQEGHIKLINQYIEELFSINFDAEGMLIGQFFNKLNLDFKPIAKSLNSNQEKQYTVEFKKDKELEISTTFIPISNNTENDFVINVKEIGKFKNNEKTLIAEQNNKINDLNEQITTLQSRLQRLQEKIDSQSKSNINFDIIDPIAKDITVNSTRMLKALNKLTRMLFDDSEKKYVSFLKNQLYHINFSIRNFAIFKENIKYNMKNNDIVKIIKKSFNFYRSDLKNKNIDVNAQFNDEIEMIKSDKVNLGISFNNILYQIIDNSTENSRIETELTREEDNILINISLINPKEKIKTMIPSKNDIETQYDFLNFIINRIINQHNGTYNIESEENRLTYKIRLTV